MVQVALLLIWPRTFLRLQMKAELSSPPAHFLSGHTVISRR